MKKRVVVTGMGAVTPVGNNVEKMWESIKAGKNGIDYITLFDTAEHKAKVAAEVKDFDPTEYIEKRSCAGWTGSAISALLQRYRPIIRADWKAPA